MSERGNEKMTVWLDIRLDTMSSEERVLLIEEIIDTLTVQELGTIRDLAERKRVAKLEEAKSAVLEEMKGKLSELGLTLNGPSGAFAQEYTVMRNTLSDNKLYGHEKASQYCISDLTVL